MNIDYLEIKKILEKGSKLQCIDVLEKLAADGTNKSIGFLCDSLAHPLWHVREKAAKLLLSFGENIIPQIELQLESENEDKIYWSIYILKNLPREKVEDIFLKYLKRYKDSPHNLIWIIKGIGELKILKAIPVLIQYFNHYKWNIRNEASRALIKLGKPSLKLLNKAFKENITSYGEENIAYWSIKTLGKILGEKGLKQLASCFSSPRENIRYYGVLSLEEIQSPKAIPFLVKMLADTSWIVRNKAMEVLFLYGEKAVPYLKKALSFRNNNVKFMALRALAGILKDKSLPILEKVAQSGNKEMKYFVIFALEGIKTRESVRVLVKFFSDNDYMFRKQAATVLIRMGNMVIEPLSEMALSDLEDDDMFFWATYVLANIGGEAVDLLVAIYDDLDEKGKKVLLTNFQYIKSKKIIPVLIKSLADPVWKIRKLSADRLIEYGDLALESIIKALENKNEDISYWIIKVMVSLGDKVIARLVELIRTGKPDVRPYAIYTLAKIATPESFAPLLEILKTGDESEKQFVVTSVADVNEEPFFDLVLKSMFDEDEDVRFWLSEILSQIGRFHVDKLIRNKDVKLPEVRYWIVRALTLTKSDRVIPVLIDLLRDEDENIRDIVYQAIEKGELGRSEIINALIEQIRRVKGEERLRVVELIGKLGAKDSIEKVGDLLESGSDEEKEALLQFFEENMDLKHGLLLVKMYENENISSPLKQKLDDLLERFSRMKEDIFLVMFKTVLKDETLKSSAKKEILKFRKKIKVEITDFLIECEEKETDEELKLFYLKEIVDNIVSATFEGKEKITQYFIAYFKARPDLIMELLAREGFLDDFARMTAMQFFEEQSEELLPLLEEYMEKEEDVRRKKIASEIISDLKVAGVRKGPTRKWEVKKKTKSTKGKGSAGGGTMSDDIEKLIEKTKRGG